MKRNFGFIAKTNTMSIMERILKAVMGRKQFMVLDVLADEGDKNTDPNADPNKNTDPNADPNKTAPTGDDNKYQVNYEDLIAKARKEEKEKLYPQIETLKKEKTGLTETVNKHLLTIESQNREIEDLKDQLKKSLDTSSKTDSEQVTELKKEVKNLKKTIADMEANTVNVEEIENKIKGEYEVKLYREQKLREGGNEIIPELVSGLTKEDIDKSFELSKERYNSIIKGVVSTATSNLPLANTDTHKFSMTDFKPEDIANMTPAEWAEKRKMLGFK